MSKSQQFQRTEEIFKFFDVGFHGDEYLLLLVEQIIKTCDLFIETGTNVGSTLSYVARSYPAIQCFSCEPDEKAFLKAKKSTNNYSNVTLFNKDSLSFLNLLEKEYKHLFARKTLFWLDAHGWGYDWPLRDELNFITSQFIPAFILIDDFKVPGLDCFGYATYDNQACSHQYIKDHIKYKKYRVYYPNYTTKTSKHHSLRGWGLITAHSEDNHIFNNPHLKIRKEEY